MTKRIADGGADRTRLDLSSPLDSPDDGCAAATRTISSLHLSAADARAAWVFDLAFGVAALAIVRSAMRVARDAAPARPAMSRAMVGGFVGGGLAVGALVAGWSLH